MFCGLNLLPALYYLWGLSKPKIVPQLVTNITGKRTSTLNKVITQSYSLHRLFIPQVHSFHSTCETNPLPSHTSSDLKVIHWARLRIPHRRPLYNAIPQVIPRITHPSVMSITLGIHAKNIHSTRSLCLLSPRGRSVTQSSHSTHLPHVTLNPSSRRHLPHLQH